MRTSIGSLLFLLLTCSALSGCGSDVKPYDPSSHSARKVFFYPIRQLAPEPVYNRVRMVNPPDVLPARTVAFEGAPKMLPVIHLDLKNATLETTAQTLAASARYRAYTSGLIANRKFSINHLGTIDELAQEIANKGDITVLIDHENREVRFFGKPPLQPELPQAKEATGSERVKDHDDKPYY